MIIIDGTGAVCFANRQVSSLFGYGHDEIVGRPVETLIPERFHARHVEHREQYHHHVRARPMGAGLQLFGRRRDGSNSSRDGYGLGLSIVQRLVKLLNLKLEVRSEVGKGTVFSLGVPASGARLRHPRAALPEGLQADELLTLMRALLASGNLVYLGPGM